MKAEVFILEAVKLSVYEILRRARLGGGTGRRTGLKIRSPARGVGVRFPSQAWKQRNLRKVTSGGLLTFGCVRHSPHFDTPQPNPPRSSGVVRSAGKSWNHAHRYAREDQRRSNFSQCEPRQEIRKLLKARSTQQLTGQQQCP